ncbi:MAG TPA: hypothetical protein VG188_01370 [Solirubrobacteraceae bacterium]|jgi:hypothetical protein|nr:hypothetical protein [Solirubrobacteraceae bacterium]
MRSSVRRSFFALLVGALIAVLAPAAAQAAIGIEKLVAVNCGVGHEGCGQEATGKTDVLGTPVFVPKEPSKAESEAEGFTQAGGHVPFGITDFKVTTEGEIPAQKPTGVTTHIRTDVAAGLATSPSAVPMCTDEQFGAAEAVPGTGFYNAPTCSGESLIGEQNATVFAEGVGDLALAGSVYNLEQANGLAAEYGVALKLPIPITKGILEKAFAEKGHPLGEPTEKALEEKQYYAHTLIEGSVEWGKQARGTNAGDYHDYFEIDVSPALPLIRSRLVFFGRSGNGSFITNATSCPGDNTTRIALTGEEKTTVDRSFTTPVGLSGCGLVPFDPTFGLSAGTNESGFDQPDGISTSVGLTRHPGATEIDSSQLKVAAVKLPEGMTLNPSAAAGLTACTPAQARIHSEAPGTDCAATSAIGTVSLDVPTLPNGSLTGTLYLGGPETGPITNPPYIVYVDAESPRYGVSVRLKGETFPNAATGQLTTVFSENPEQPFTNIVLSFKGGALAPIANPLSCAAGRAEGSFLPYTEIGSKTIATPFSSTGCPSTIPFSLSQTTSNQTANAGGNTSYTFSLTRPAGNQYLGAVKTTLPAGLVGQIPKATQCTEAQASAEPSQCPDSSQIGVASAIAGAGPTPFAFGGGKVYLTGPYQGAPFGLLVTVPAVAGPFNLGEVKTRARINIDPFTARVTTTANIPTIQRGIPTRLRGVTISINKQGFLLNPTNCSALSTDSTVTSTDGASQNLASPFQVGNCNLLKFKPAFKATTSSKTSKANGASLETTLNEVPGQANVKSVKVQLPKALPSRLTTLQKACPAATFEADPFKCPSGSFVGGARANTPTLPGKLSGPAILVSHANEAFPDLDLVMEANGVRAILIGNTDIKNGITTTTFASTPDVPVSSITVNLPLGAHSALAANGNLCANPLVMPTTMTGQNGVVVKQNTTIKVNTCGVRVVGHKVVGNTAYITVRTFAAGRISGKGASVATRFRKLAKAQKKVTIKVPLSRAGSRRRGPFKVKLRVGFVPKAKGARSSAAFVTVTFR